MGEIESFKEMVASKAGSEQGSPPNVESVSQTATFGDRATRRLCGGTFPLFICSLISYGYLGGGTTLPGAMVGSCLLLALAWLLSPIIRFRGLLSPVRLLICTVPLTLYTVTILTIVQDMEGRSFLYNAIVSGADSLEQFFFSPELNPWSFTLALQKNLETVLTIAPTAMILLSALLFGVLFTKLSRNHPWIRARKPGLFRLTLSLLVLLGPLLAYGGLWVAVQPSQQEERWLEETEKLDPLDLGGEREVWGKFWGRAVEVREVTYFRDSSTDAERALAEELFLELDKNPPQSLHEAARVAELLVYLQRVLVQVDEEQANYELARTQLMIEPLPGTPFHQIFDSILGMVEKTDHIELWLGRVEELQDLIPATTLDELDIHTRRFYSSPIFVPRPQTRRYSVDGRLLCLRARPLEVFGLKIQASPTNLWRRWNLSRGFNRWLNIREQFADAVEEAFLARTWAHLEPPLLERDISLYYKTAVHTLDTRPKLETAELILKLRLEKEETGRFPDQLPEQFQDNFSWEKTSEGWELARTGSDESWVLK